jgi:hypothetical protein
VVSREGERENEKTRERSGRRRRRRGVEKPERGRVRRSRFFFPSSSPSSSKYFSKKNSKQKHRYDANISLPGCDKNMPGTIIAASRLDRPSLMIYGGTIKPGLSKQGEPLDIVSAFQSYGKREFLVSFLLLLLLPSSFFSFSLALRQRRRLV